MTSGSADPKYKTPSGARYSIAAYQPAIILYPSLFTPEIIVGDDDLEIILLGMSTHAITPDNVNLQLKFTQGLDPMKPYDKHYLFDKQEAEVIAVARGITQQKTYENPLDACFTITYTGKFPDSEIISTGERFCGLIDQRFLDLIGKLPWPYSALDTIYCLSIANDFFRKRPGVYNLFWLFPANGKFNFPMPGVSQAGADENPSFCANLTDIVSGKLSPNEFQDGLIQNVLTSCNCAAITRANTLLPFTEQPAAVSPYVESIQSFHPVYYFESTTISGIAHIADYHLNSRQYFLSKSKARVIPYPREKEAAEKGDESEIIPGIGGMMNNCFKNVDEILNQFTADSQVNALVVGGDIIDYIQGLNPTNKHKTTLEGIWDAVMTGSTYAGRALDYADFGTFFFRMLDFAQRKPVFVVSGNHDVYYEPYGISPRVGPIRGNAGIPADHNLTIYEAILAFGETYKDKGSGTFYPDKFKWFYAILTPFSDFAQFLPRQCILGLGWGDDEDKVGITEYQEKWYGHLPRADKSISDKQYKLLNEAKQKVAKKGKIILCSHFTFVSYLSDVPMNKQEEGIMQVSESPGAISYGNFDSGTFEIRREQMYEELAKHGDQEIRCILTGHSHRKGLYSIGKINTRRQVISHMEGIDKTVKSIDTRIYDIEKVSKNSLSDIDPAIIVSDCAGPIPRYNKEGEFLGWGSDQPSGTKVLFGPGGELSGIEIVKATQKPRFAVAVDYFDLVGKNQTIQDFVGFERGDSIVLHLRFNDAITHYARIERITLYAKFKNRSGDPWQKLIMRGGNDTWTISQIENVYTFKMMAKDERFIEKWSDLKGKWKDDWEYRHGAPSFNTVTVEIDGDKQNIRMAQTNLEKTFLAIKFTEIDNAISRKYDFKSAWCFPVFVGVGYDGASGTTFRINRSGNETEFPDFEWYKKNS